MPLNATIVQVAPETEWDGVVQTQHVVVQIDDTNIGLFDPNVVIDPSEEGEVHTLEIDLLTPESGPKVKASAERGIRPNPKNPTGWKKHTFIGTVDGIHDREYNELVLDIGVGTITLAVSEELFETISEGDCLEVTALRSDLVKVL